LYLKTLTKVFAASTSDIQVLGLSYVMFTLTLLKSLKWFKCY